MRRIVRVGLLVGVITVLSGIPSVGATTPSGRGGECLEHTVHTTDLRGRIPRDDVHLAGLDELTRWMQRHPARAARSGERAGGPVTVPVAFHVIRRDLTPEGGNVPASQIAAQMKVLNDSFSGRTGGARTGFRFELESVDRTTARKWFHLTGYGQDAAMKAALKVGGPDTLNIYSANLGALLLGYAYLAQDADEVGVLDGVVIHYKSLPDAGFAGFDIYDEGDTATHEVGHWFDLLHTFEGGCESPGDHVADTAPEASPAFNCPTGRDTCPGGGLDPITNFMDYSQDSCMYAFTPGQATRMQQAWAAYRAP